MENSNVSDYLLVNVVVLTKKQFFFITGYSEILVKFTVTIGFKVFDLIVKRYD